MSVLKAITAALLISASISAIAQSYPDKPIKIIVPFAAGGNADIVARLIGKKLSEGLSTPVVVENRVGANGAIGLEAVKRAAPDGYTLLVSPTSPLVINPAIYAKLPYDTLADFQPISQIITYQYALIVPEKSAIKTVQDLAAQAKAKPGELTYGSSGVGGWRSSRRRIARTGTGCEVEPHSLQRHGTSTGRPSGRSPLVHVRHCSHVNSTGTSQAGTGIGSVGRSTLEFVAERPNHAGVGIQDI